MPVGRGGQTHHRHDPTTGGPAVTTRTIPAGSSSVGFFYGDTTAGTPTLTTSTVTVTIAILANPANGVLNGAKSKPAIGGVVTFTDLSITNPGDGYTLRITRTGLTSATSMPITIS